MHPLGCAAKRESYSHALRPHESLRDPDWFVERLIVGPPLETKGVEKPVFCECVVLVPAKTNGRRFVVIRVFGARKTVQAMDQFMCQVNIRTFIHWNPGVAEIDCAHRTLSITRSGLVHGLVHSSQAGESHRESGFLPDTEFMFQEVLKSRIRDFSCHGQWNGWIACGGVLVIKIAHLHSISALNESDWYRLENHIDSRWKVMSVCWIGPSYAFQQADADAIAKPRVCKDSQIFRDYCFEKRIRAPLGLGQVVISEK